MGKVYIHHRWNSVPCRTHEVQMARPALNADLSCPGHAGGSGQVKKHSSEVPNRGGPGRCLAGLRGADGLAREGHRQISDAAQTRPAADHAGAYFDFFTIDKVRCAMQKPLPFCPPAKLTSYKLPIMEGMPPMLRRMRNVNFNCGLALQTLRYDDEG